MLKPLDLKKLEQHYVHLKSNLVYMRYWPSVRARWQDIVTVVFLFLHSCGWDEVKVHKEAKAGLNKTKRG